MTTAIKSVSVSLELIELLKKYKISPSEAFRVGASLILSENGEPQFINRLNIGRRISNLQEIVKEQQKKLQEYEDVLEKK
jgi:hypothetical protein